MRPCLQATFEDTRYTYAAAQAMLSASADGRLCMPKAVSSEAKLETTSDDA